MSETRYTRQTGVELNNDNLPTVIGQILNKDYIDKFEVSFEGEYLSVTFHDGGVEVFDFNDHIMITKDTIQLAKENNTTYTGYWLYKPDALKKLHYADNVKAYSIDKEYGRIHVHTTYKCHTMDTNRGVIVFDDDGDFVEVFKPDTPKLLSSVMVEHGYKKVE